MCIRDSAIVPPDIPGIKSANPIANPLRKIINDFKYINYFKNSSKVSPLIPILVVSNAITSSPVILPRLTF